MPKLKNRPLPPATWPLSTGSAAGSGPDDFYVLGFSTDYNDHYAPLNPPVEEYTHILHYKNLKKDKVCEIPDRLGKIWWSPSGKAYIIGNPEGIIEVDASGCRETAMNNLPGVFTAIWGTGEDHLFTCGIFETFILNRRLGAWRQMKLPMEIPLGLHAIDGFNEHDVYFAGHGGVILHYNGRDLCCLDSPTTRTLLCIALLDEQTLCIGGYDGVLLFGNKNGWRMIDTNTDEPIYSLARFENQVCFASPDGIFAFNGKKAPTQIVDQPAVWINGFEDAITFSDETSTWFFDGKKLVKMDTVI